LRAAPVVHPPAHPHARCHADHRQRYVRRGPADTHLVHSEPPSAISHQPLHAGADDDHGGGHGHGPWHGPHESPTAMTYPLMALAVGAIVAGFVGIPAAIGGNNAIEQFLEPSFTAERAAGDVSALEPAGGATEQPGEHVSAKVEVGLMLFSLLVAVAGIAVAYKYYVTSPEISEQLAERFAGAHRTLSNKYYVDELYDATVVSGTMASGRGLWTFDRNVVDGAVNGTSWVTVISSWFS